MKGDLAVIEGKDDNGFWDDLAFIGKGRIGGTIGSFMLYCASDIRIRYLDEDGEKIEI